MKPHKLSLRQICMAAFSGGLLSLAFPRAHLSVLAWVGLIPLFLILRKTTSRSSFLLGWICGSVYFGGTLFWIVQTMTTYGHIALWQSLLIAIALISYLSCYIGIFAALWNWFRRLHGSMAALLIAPLVWTSSEFLRAHLLTGFPWSTLGYSQYSHLHLIQFADTTGVYGVSFLIVLVNVCLATLLEYALAGKEEKIMPGASFCLRIALALLLVLGLTSGYGVYKMRSLKPQPEETLAVGIIQGNIPQEEKWDREQQEKVYGIYESLTLQAAREKPDIIIWPEASTPFINEQQGEYMARISPLVRQAGVPMVVGTPRIDGRGKNRLRNSAFFFSLDGKILDYYDKIHLVPFGEYLPLGMLLSYLGSVVNEVGEFSAGNRYTIFHLNRLRFGLVICYEVIFPSLFRQFTRQGVNFMVNITNDAWFDRSAAPYQHFSMAVFRAIENGITIVRVANTGISGFIDPVGRILFETPLFQRMFAIKHIEPQRKNTFYARYGDIFAEACLIALGLLLIFSYRTIHLLKKPEGRIHYVL